MKLTFYIKFNVHNAYISNENEIKCDNKDPFDYKEFSHQLGRGKYRITKVNKKSIVVEKL